MLKKTPDHGLSVQNLDKIIDAKNSTKGRNVIDDLEFCKRVFIPSFYR